MDDIRTGCGRTRPAAADGQEDSTLPDGLRPTTTRSKGEWRSGFTFPQSRLTNVLNPRAALVILSILPQFVHGGGSASRQFFLLGTLDIVIGVAYWFILVAVTARLRAFFARPKVRHRWEPTTGWRFINIGLGLPATASKR
ncbi:hypothetical protein P1P68_00765 [Streptomyces scabiei]|uniref:LysE family translocator n=1 Tax=Streptomyces scabiei TaxID=1930 RepID=UPI00298FCEE7|nr:LysE family transporter [Streptomyces scabiei]MDW8803379.1 hypothetical protein [Streptomyces scabiei]